MKVEEYATNVGEYFDGAWYIYLLLIAIKQQKWISQIFW